MLFCKNSKRLVKKTTYVQYFWIVVFDSYKYVHMLSVQPVDFVACFCHTSFVDIRKLIIIGLFAKITSMWYIAEVKFAFALKRHICGISRLSKNRKKLSRSSAIFMEMSRNFERALDGFKSSVVIRKTPQNQR